MIKCEIKWVGSRLQSTVLPAHEPFRPRQKAKNMRGQFGFERGAGMESAVEAFPEEWSEYQGLTSRRAGALLEHVPGMTKSKIAELNYMNIHTAEQLASLGDGGIHALGIGGRALVDMAKAWLIETTDKKASAEALAEKAAMEERIAKLEAALAQTMQAAPAAVISDDVEAWSEDALREFLTARGASLRANAAIDKLRAAVRDIRETEAQMKAYAE
jgi:hypothetical protein